MPCSLRRAGASYYFKIWVSFDNILLHGRWESVKVARIYVNDARAASVLLSFDEGLLRGFQRREAKLLELLRQFGEEGRSSDLFFPRAAS